MMLSEGRERGEDDDRTTSKPGAAHDRSPGMQCHRRTARPGPSTKRPTPRRRRSPTPRQRRAFARPSNRVEGRPGGRCERVGQRVGELARVGLRNPCPRNTFREVPLQHEVPKPSSRTLATFPLTSLSKPAEVIGVDVATQKSGTFSPGPVELAEVRHDHSNKRIAVKLFQAWVPPHLARMWVLQNPRKARRVKHVEQPNGSFQASVARLDTKTVRLRQVGETHGEVSAAQSAGAIPSRRERSAGRREHGAKNEPPANITDDASPNAPPGEVALGAVRDVKLACGEARPSDRTGDATDPRKEVGHIAPLQPRMLATTGCFLPRTMSAM